MDGKPSSLYVGTLNFLEKSGSSMLCTSMCREEDISKCKHVHQHEGVCVGDSGGKLYNKYFHGMKQHSYPYNM